MTHVVTARCVDCRYTYCVVECPVSCFYEVKDPHMLVIDPGTCIDCEACVPQCPVNAIYPDHELPSEYADWEAKNAELFEQGLGDIGVGILGGPVGLHLGDGDAIARHVVAAGRSGALGCRGGRGGGRTVVVTACGHEQPDGQQRRGDPGA